MLEELQIKNGPRKLIMENIKWKRALETQQGQFERMLEMYTETRETARALKSKSGDMDLNWDLLQVQYNTHIENKLYAIVSRILNHIPDVLTQII